MFISGQTGYRVHRSQVSVNGVDYKPNQITHLHWTYNTEQDKKITWKKNDIKYIVLMTQTEANLTRSVFFIVSTTYLRTKLFHN